MEWYYVEAGNQAGPVSEADLDQLIASGRVGPETLVWRDGMANWLPLRQARPGVTAAAPPPSILVDPAPFAPAPAAAPAASATGTNVVCAQCGGIFPRESTIQYGSSYVCAACKPTFVQKLKEGVPTGSESLTYAGFWIRFCAKFVDGLVLLVIVIPLFVVVGVTAFRGMSSQRPNVLGPLVNLGAQFVITGAMVAYTTFFHGKWGATLGKMACGLKVVTPEGTPISYARSFGRSMAEILSGLICYIGYIIAGFDSQKRSLHDHIANTRVIRVR